MFSVVLRPIPVENASGIVVPVEERRSWQRREDVEVREFDWFFVRKSTARSNTASSSLSKSEYDTRIHHDAVFMEHLDLLRKLLDPIERFVGLIQTVFVERFHPHEYRDAAAFGS